jgi:hypothetical protein
MLLLLSCSVMPVKVRCSIVILLALLIRNVVYLAICIPRFLCRVGEEGTSFVCWVMAGQLKETKSIIAKVKASSATLAEVTRESFHMDTAAATSTAPATTARA